MLAVIAPPSALTVTVFNLRRAITGSQFRRVTDGSSAHPNQHRMRGRPAHDRQRHRALDEVAESRPLCGERSRPAPARSRGYLYRDGLMAVPGLDDAGRWIPWVWAWVINLAVGNRPLILQKSGGLQGCFAISGDSAAPGVAAFFVMNEFSRGGCTAAVAATNGLIGQLVPR
jgi:hypothetical protein